MKKKFQMINGNDIISQLIKNFANEDEVLVLPNDKEFIDWLWKKSNDDHCKIK